MNYFNSLYEYNDDEIYNNVINYCNNSKHNILKLQGYRLIRNENNSLVFAWKKMNIHFFTIKLDTFIMLKVNLNNDEITDIELSNHFSGSQGVKCNQEVLSKHLKDTFIGEKLSLRNIKIKNMKTSWCRHVYELLYGMCDFINLCEKDNCVYFEENFINAKLNKFIINDKFILNNIEHSSVLDVSNLNVKLDKNINIVKDGKIKFNLVFDNIETYSEVVKFDGHDDFYKNVFMSVYNMWKNINEKLGIDNALSFSELWPSTLFSYIVEILSIYKFKSLNKCIENFQRKDDKPMCLGFTKEGEIISDRL